jgi:hypothetical protein
VSPYILLYVATNRSRWVNPQRCAIQATVLVGGIGGAQIPVGAAEPDQADIRHRRHAQVTPESLL